MPGVKVSGLLPAPDVSTADLFVIVKNGRTVKATGAQVSAMIAGGGGAAGGAGTVTSVAVSGGTTGLTASGGPITDSGTITLAGTLAVAAGGTGSTTAGDARTALGAAAATQTITAGAGLTGGGTLAADRTLSLSTGAIASLALADSATQPGDGISTLSNDAAYINAAGAPVQSVAGRTGAVTLAVADVSGAASASRAITAGTGLTGGGTLAADRTISLSSGSVASLARADTALQPADLSAASRVLWVDPAGNDAAAGDLPTAPLQTITAALAAATAGDVIRVRAGIYTEACPMVLPRDVSVVGDGLRVVEVRPTPVTATQHMWLVDSGAYLTGMTFARHQAGAWAVSFNAAADNTAIGASGLGAYVLKSPYIQNCTSYTAQDDSGLAGSTSDGTTGGGMEVDGAKCAPNSPIRSMVVDSYTQVNLDGPGCLVKNDAYAQLVSFFGTFCSYHVRAESGGQVNLSNSTTDFGTYALMASGRSATPLFSGVAGAALADVTQVTVTSLTSNRLGNSNRPAAGMVFEVAGVTYTVTGSLPVTGGYDVLFYPRLAAALDGGEAVAVYLRSQVSTGGHVMEYVGAGTNYLALPWNGGIPIPANEIVEEDGGRVFFSSTDQLGNFRVGNTFDVNGTTGAMTISAPSFGVANISAIGPFSRNGGFSTVGVQLQEISNNTSLLASTGAADGNTVPTQYAVVTYLANTYTPQARVITAGTGLDGGGTLAADRTVSLSSGSIASLALADTALQAADLASGLAGIDVGATLGANTFSGAQNLADNELLRPLIRDCAEAVTSPTISGGTLTLNLENGNVFTVSLNGNITTLTISNPPASGRAGSFTLILTADGTARTVTWPAAVKWAGGTAPTLTSTNAKKDIIVMTTLDEGTSYFAVVAGQNF